MSNSYNGGRQTPLLHDPDRTFAYGDWVESKLNEDIFGIVVDFDPHGIIYKVQLAGSGNIISCYGATLMPLDPSELEPVADDEVDVPATADVIDFTKARDLRREKVRGAA